MFHPWTDGLHRRYDLKGSNYRRTRLPPGMSIDDERAPTQLLDDDVRTSRKKFNVGDGRDTILSQIRSDTKFLADHNLYDYSFLIGEGDTALAPPLGWQDPQRSSPRSGADGGSGRQRQHTGTLCTAATPLFGETVEDPRIRRHGGVLNLRQALDSTGRRQDSVTTVDPMLLSQTVGSLIVSSSDASVTSSPSLQSQPQPQLPPPAAQPAVDGTSPVSPKGMQPMHTPPMGSSLSGTSQPGSPQQLLHGKRQSWSSPVLQQQLAMLPVASFFNAVAVQTRDDDGGHVTFMGIIDFLEQHTIKRSAERVLKKVISRGKDPTAVEPRRYATRTLR